MSARYLPIFVEDAALTIERLLPAMSRGDLPIARALEFCRHCRIRGIGSLFVDGTPDVLRRELSRSARALASVLRKKPHAEQATGQLFPFLDAVAAADLDGARAIAAAARPTWNEGEEYEEDFLYLFFLMKCFFLGADRVECEALLARWEAVIDGASDIKLAICRALLARDAAAFEAALVNFLDAEKDRYARLAAAGVLAQVTEVTEARLSVEGIALVRLARAAGLATESDYRGVPSLALGGQPLIYGPDAWQSL